jgi:hypothetical protein
MFAYSLLLLLLAKHEPSGRQYKPSLRWLIGSHHIMIMACSFLLSVYSSYIAWYAAYMWCRAFIMIIHLATKIKVMGLFYHLCYRLLLWFFFHRLSNRLSVLRLYSVRWLMID